MKLLLHWIRIVSADFSIMSLYFYACLAFFALVYYTIARKLRVQWMLILAASIFFYFANSSIKLFLFLLAPIIFTYLMAFIINDLQGFKKSLIVFATVCTNVLFLIYFKERNFFVITHNLLSLSLHLKQWQSVNIIAPLGVSYLSLMLISYILDVAWGTVSAQKNPLKFLCYVIYFPILTSGPITRYSEIENQIFAVRDFNYDRFCFGIQRIAWGFFKKLVIAERIGVIVSTVYGSWQNYQGFTLAVGLLAYVLQMYTDFSGCIDMVLGVSECLGISLPENFRQPFFSTNLSEIWRRWHMTLGFWVKDYVLYPILKSSAIQKLSALLKSKLGKKNRYAKLIPTWCGMFATWFAVGFWHGGQLKYIFGGGLFFFAMIAGGQVLEPLFAVIVKILRINTKTASYRFFLRLRTFFLFAAAVSFQRAQSLKTGFQMWKRVFADFNPYIFFDNTLFRLGLDAKDFIVMIIGLLIVLLVSNMEQTSDGTQKHVRVWLSEQNIAFRWFIYFGLFFSVIVYGMYGYGFNPKDFIYGGF